MKLYYMRDNHTFRPLPLDVDEAVAVVREEYAAGHTYGMLCTKSVPTNDPFGNGPEPNPHGRASFDEFEPRVRAWMQYVLSYKSPGDLEYESWAHVSGATPCTTCGGSGEVRDWETIHGKRRAVVNNCTDCTPGVVEADAIRKDVRRQMHERAHGVTAYRPTQTDIELLTQVISREVEDPDLSMRLRELRDALALGVMVGGANELTLATDEHLARSAFLSKLDPEDMLEELLATIHGDGGHYSDEYGLAKAVADAEARWYARGVTGREAPSITDEELTRRFTRCDYPGPNPMYRCNGCGAEELGVRNLLVEHARTCGVKGRRFTGPGHLGLFDTEAEAIAHRDFVNGELEKLARSLAKKSKIGRPRKDRAE